MGKKLAIKLLLIGLTLLLLLIPLAMLDGLVAERQSRGWQVAREIAASAGSEQTVIGPLLLLESVRTVRREKTVTESGTLRQISETARLRVHQLLPPSDLQVDTQLRSERRSRGPFDALLFHSEQSLRVRFVLPAAQDLDAESESLRLERVSLILAVSDNRGISQIKVELAGEQLQVLPGSGLVWQPHGIHAPLATLPAAGQSLELDIALSLSGSRSLAWVPLADDNRFAVSSDWPHPGFAGSFLPQSKHIDAQGFRGNWQISRLASGAQQLLSQCQEQASACEQLLQSALAVRLVDPVDRYLMTDRAIKYALLFLAIIFGAVFFVETLAAVPVHAMQYALTGLAMASFFLLLLALSEHLGFALAYAIAATACGVLITLYMAPAFASRKRSLGFAALMLTLYGLLYCLLRSEDMALLAGSLGLFALLATVMLASRRLDWSRWGGVGSQLTSST